MKVSPQYAESIRRELYWRMKDYTGFVRGRLTMLYPTTQSISGSGVKWIAKCDCGNLTLCVPSNLKNNSCGCLRVENSVPAAFESRRKLTDMQVSDIKRSSEKCVVLGAIYGVSHSTISSIRTGRRYAEVQ